MPEKEMLERLTEQDSELALYIAAQGLNNVCREAKYSYKNQDAYSAICHKYLQLKPKEVIQMWDYLTDTSHEVLLSYYRPLFKQWLESLEQEKEINVK